MTIIGAVLLNGIVGQVDEHVINLVQIVGLAGHPDVPFLEVVAFVLRRDQNPQSDVKLTLVDQ